MNRKKMLHLEAIREKNLEEIREGVERAAKLAFADRPDITFDGAHFMMADDEIHIDTGPDGGPEVTLCAYAHRDRTHGAAFSRLNPKALHATPDQLGFLMAGILFGHIDSQDNPYLFNVLTTSEARQILGVTRQRMEQLIRTDKLIPEKRAGRTHLFLRRDVEARLAEQTTLRQKHGGKGVAE